MPGAWALMCSLSEESTASSSCIRAHAGQSHRVEGALVRTVNGMESSPGGAPCMNATMSISRTATRRSRDDSRIAR